MTETTSQEYFEVNFSDILPIYVKAGDIADIIKAVESMVEAQICLKNPALKKESVILSFTSIDSHSIDLQFSSPFVSETNSAFIELGQAVKNNDYSRLPSSSFNALSIISLFARKHGSKVEFISRNHEYHIVAVVTPETIVERPPVLAGETTIYAKVIRVGGREPKVEIETLDGRLLFCKAPIEITTRLGTKLYQTVGLVGVAEWKNDVDNNISEFTIEGIIDYIKVPLKEAMQKLAEVSGKYYSDLDDVDSYISEIRDSN